MKKALSKKDLEDIKYFFNKYYKDNKKITIKLFLSEALELILDKYDLTLSKVAIHQSKNESDAIYNQEEDSMFLNTIMKNSNSINIKDCYTEEKVHLPRKQLQYMSYLICIETIIHEMEHKKQTDALLGKNKWYTDNELELLRYCNYLTSEELYIKELKQKGNKTDTEIIEDLEKIYKTFIQVYYDLYDYDPIEREAYATATNYSKLLVDNANIDLKKAALYFAKCTYHNNMNAYQPLNENFDSFSPTEAFITLQDKEILIPKIKILHDESLSIKQKLIYGASITKGEFNDLTSEFKDKIRILK